uniref:THD domain-containing protein n=1 Tax=Malurus cyaneus samueli TaxID=2593467 RepID=A0A8C5UKH6_9PASS
MEAPTLLENGNDSQKRKSTCLQLAFYVPIFVLMIIISVVASILFCLLLHKQVRTNWDWKLDHCNGIVRDQEQYLVIEQSGKYFIYAQLFRKDKMKEPFSLMVYKDPKIPLNNILGHENGTANFARPFFLEKGDKLYCKQNGDLDKNLLETQTYWGLFKM